ncbi:MAG: hypothetical protein R3F50_02620 [Gammaproteobacteria bacterium]
MKIIPTVVPAVIFLIGVSTGYFFNLHTSRLHSLRDFAENTLERREEDIMALAALLIAAESLDYQTFINSADEQNANYWTEEYNDFNYVYFGGLIIKFSPEGALTEIMINSL